MTVDTLPLTWGPVDEATGARIDATAKAEGNQVDRQIVETAIWVDAADHGGHVSPNRVRAWLAGPEGLVVKSQVIGATYRALATAGVLVVDGVETSDDKAGGNAGKPSRTYRLSP